MWATLSGSQSPAIFKLKVRKQREIFPFSVLWFFFRYFIEEGGERARVVPDHRGGQHSAGAGGAPGAGHLLLLLQEGKQRCVDWTNDKIFQSLSFWNKLKSSEGCPTKTNYSVLMPCPALGLSRVKFYTQITSDALFIFREAKIENEKSYFFRNVSSFTNCRFLCYWRKFSFSV